MHYSYFVAEYSNILLYNTFIRVISGLEIEFTRKWRMLPNVITEIEIYLIHSHRTNELTVSFSALLFSHPTHIQCTIMIYFDGYCDLVTLHVILVDPHENSDGYSEKSIAYKF